MTAMLLGSGNEVDASALEIRHASGRAALKKSSLPLEA